ncbi:MAG: beta-ketoacyl-ACP synthase III [Myxococcota bacterium]
MRAQIVGTGRALPARVMTNADLEKMVATSDAWIVERTGVKERRILEAGRAASDLAAEAARNACRAAGVAPQELDCIIVSTVTPDMPFPACATLVQEKLGALGGAAFDLSAACAGFIYALSAGDAFVQKGQFRRVLVVGVEVLSRVTDWTDRNTCVLFGDGAGAVVLVPGAAASARPTGRGDSGILSTHLYADGSAWSHLCIPAGGSALPASASTVEARQHYVKMNGREIYKLAVRNMAQASLAALEANGVSPDAVDKVIPHQANLRIIEGVAQRCGLPLSKFYLNLADYGNTSSASIPIALDEALETGAVKTGDLVLMCALGAGVSWGSALVRL